MKCPWCGQTHFIPSVVYVHTEAYGPGHKNFRCIWCEKVVSAYFGIKIVVDGVKKSDKKQGDWG